MTDRLRTGEPVAESRCNHIPIIILEMEHGALAWSFGPERFTTAPTVIGGCSPSILIQIGCSSGMPKKADWPKDSRPVKPTLADKQQLWLGGRAIHVLKHLEKLIHLHWLRTFEVAKRAVGVMVLLLTAVLVLTRVPLSNVAPAIVISLISLAYVEEDGLLLSVGFLAAIILIGLGSAAVWGALVGAMLISA
jgi:Exopolysaccharide synthesis, ExoD